MSFVNQDTKRRRVDPVRFAGHGPLQRYTAAIIVAGLAILLRYVLNPLLGEKNPYHTLWAAVVFSAWFCGLGPSILTAVLGLAGVWYWFIDPSGSLKVLDAAAAAGMVGFVLFAGLIIAMGEANRRAARERQKIEAALRAAHEELEDRVRDRTYELSQATQGLRDLTGRLLRSQDDERRRISRELHDSLGQMLAAVSMNLAFLQSSLPPFNKEQAANFEDTEALIQQISTEVRTLSHLLHPPLLDEVGLESALSWYVQGFGERSGISTDLKLDPGINRLPREMELVIFRIVQECLTNVHRHSGSATAKVQVARRDGKVRVEVEDTGHGVTAEQLKALNSAGTAGVGLRGMRERVRQLGGDITVLSREPGMLVAAELPVIHP
jgi:signal transduction histidine kinase